MPSPWPETEEESEAKRPRVSEESLRSRECRRSIQSAGGICWSSRDLALAAKLLETPNARFPTITFGNVEERRRVFTLVYDVLRYKSVLNQALNDVHFFTRYSYLKERCHLVWLLFLDLYKRDFTLRDPLEPEVGAAFHAQGLYEIDEVLWQLRVKLAATVSRLRIKSGAHSLSNLLPHHLQITRSTHTENIVSGWVNIFKTSMKDTCACLDTCGFSTLPREREELEPLTYKTDHLLPRFLHIRPNEREDLVESPLIENHHIIMQERTFCLGPAVMAQLLKNYSLSGKVAQTHVNSPITMAYFANLLINNEKIESLLVFGAGYRKEACEQYLKQLGVKNTRVFSESFSALSPENRVLDNVIAVLATPPNTNSSVVDPVDLAVARGGDLQILQQLTDDDFASTPRGDHINTFLRDQRDTLRRGMSKPQIQFIVYETHSRFHCENEEMATNLVNELNNYAREVHLEELRRAQGETQEQERSQGEMSESAAEVPTIKVDEELALPLPTPKQSVQIPPSDLFEVGELPDLCPNFEGCLDLESEGTYIAVIKRKEITRLDPKYMIQMAEARGLFGRPDATPKAKTPGQTARAKAALAALQARSDSFEKSKTKVKVEMDRIAAPTRASILRDVHAPSAKDCPRYAHHLAHDGTPSYKGPETIPRKSFLTTEEEERLIRRLYICPQLNIFPPQLNEDLPPLKFWNSPASVIECYLQRKVFQKRLQIAYEFNQRKEPHEQIMSFQDAVEDSEDKLTKAVNQLTNEISYFTYLKQTHDSDDALQTQGDRNKELWDEIRPEKRFQLPEENKISTEDEKVPTNEYKNKLCYDIRKRFSEFSNFYKLQNLRSDDKPPLALTIDQSPEECISEEESIESRNQEERVTFHLTSEKDDDSESSSEEFEDSIDFRKKLPQLQPSEYCLRNNEKLEKILKKVRSVTDDLDSLLPQVPLNDISKNFRRGTLLSLKDSIELAHKRMSTRASLNLSELFNHSNQHVHIPKDSLELVTDKLPKVNRDDSTESHTSEEIIDTSQFNSLVGPQKQGPRNTITGHKDSLLLALQRVASKDKVNKDLKCDICNGTISNSIQFLCDFHAALISSQPSQSSQSIISSKTKSYLSHKDSVVITKKRTSIKVSRKSVACQVDKRSSHKERLQVKNASTLKGSMKTVSKQLTEEKSNENITKSPLKLKNYLMGAMQVNEVDILNNSSSIKYV